MTSVSKYLMLLTIPLLLTSCGDKEALKNNYTLTTNVAKNSTTVGNDITFSLNAKKTLTVDSVTYFMNGNRVASQPNTSDFTTALNTKKLGYKNVEARVYTVDGTTSATVKVILLNNTAPKAYGYNIVNRFPHNTDAYTQGLEFVGDTLYESNGEYGKSSLVI